MRREPIHPFRMHQALWSTVVDYRVALKQAMGLLHRKMEKEDISKDAKRWMIETTNLLNHPPQGFESHFRRGLKHSEASRAKDKD